jgi:Cation transport ATPase
MIEWHLIDIEKVIEFTGSSEKGLSTVEATGRLQKYGVNEITQIKKIPAWLMFLYQFKDFMILVLILAAIISGLFRRRNRYYCNYNYCYTECNRRFYTGISCRKSNGSFAKDGCYQRLGY